MADNDTAPVALLGPEPMRQSSNRRSTECDPASPAHPGRTEWGGHTPSGNGGSIAAASNSMVEPGDGNTKTTDLENSGEESE